MHQLPVGEERAVTRRLGIAEVHVRLPAGTLRFELALIVGQTAFQLGSHLVDGANAQRAIEDETVVDGAGARHVANAPLVVGDLEPITGRGFGECGFLALLGIGFHCFPSTSAASVCKTEGDQPATRANAGTVLGSLRSRVPGVARLGRCGV